MKALLSFFISLRISRLGKLRGQTLIGWRCVLKILLTIILYYAWMVVSEQFWGSLWMLCDWNRTWLRIMRNFMLIMWIYMNWNLILNICPNIWPIFYWLKLFLRNHDVFLFIVICWKLIFIILSNFVFLWCKFWMIIRQGFFRQEFILFTFLYSIHFSLLCLIVIIMHFG